MMATARDILLNYWAKYADKPTVQSMMLNDHAELVDASDRADVMMGLPNDLVKRRVLEIGAGIGQEASSSEIHPANLRRFTQLLAKRSHHVIATDFIASFIEKNQELHGHYKNVSFEVGDAVNLKQESESQDFVFTNWLLMYLTDEEMFKFFMNALRILTPDGYMTLRESCTESSTKTKAKGAGSENPTNYRHVSVYIRTCHSLRFVDHRGDMWMLEPLWSRSIETYVQVKENWRQCQMLFKKARADTPPLKISLSTTTTDAMEVIQEGNEKQSRWDAYMYAESTRATTDTERALVEVVAQNTLEFGGQYVLNLVPSLYNPFIVAKEGGHFVTSMSTDPHEYSALLHVANCQLDQKVRAHWLNPNAEPTKLPQHFFDWVVLTAEQRDASEFLSVQHSLKPSALLYVVSATGDVSVDPFSTQKGDLPNSAFVSMSYDDSTDDSPVADWEEEQ